MSTNTKYGHGFTNDSPWYEWATQQRSGSLGNREKQEQGLTSGELVSFGNRITYTFHTYDEVASIHFDRGSGKIFYKGHHIANHELTSAQITRLCEFTEILEQSDYSEDFLADYEQALRKALLCRETRPRPQQRVLKIQSLLV